MFDAECEIVHNDDAYKKLLQDFIDGADGLTERFKHMAVTFIRVGNQKDLFLKVHAPNVMELTIHKDIGREHILGLNVVAVYWEAPEVNYDLEKDLCMRARSRFGDDYKYYRKIHL